MSIVLDSLQEEDGVFAIEDMAYFGMDFRSDSSTGNDADTSP